MESLYFDESTISRWFRRTNGNLRSKRENWPQWQALQWQASGRPVAGQWLLWIGIRSYRLMLYLKLMQESLLQNSLKAFKWVMVICTVTLLLRRQKVSMKKHRMIFAQELLKLHNTDTIFLSRIQKRKWGVKEAIPLWLRK